MEKTFLKEVEESIQTKNNDLIEIFKNEEKSLNSPEWIKIVFSSNLLEDINFLEAMSSQEFFKCRYADLIIRNLSEQVIEFIYLMENPEKIQDYIGEHANVPENPAEIMTENIVENFRLLGSRRYSNGRLSVSKMADEINEKTSVDGELSLYDIYILLSEECHNSYFFSILDDLDSENQPLAMTDTQDTYLTIIIGRFLECYLK